MTNEKILERLYKIKSVAGSYELSMLIADVEKDIKESEYAKQSKGNKDILKYAKAILKDAERVIKNHCFNKEGIKYPFYNTYDGKNYQCVTNAYMVVAFAESLPLEECPDCIDRYGNDMLKSYTPNYSKEIELPDINSLDTYIKCRKAENKSKGKYADKRIIIDLDTSLKCAFNAEYISWIMHCLGGNVRMYGGSNYCYYFKSDDNNNIAMCMGIGAKDYAKRIKTEF